MLLMLTKTLTTKATTGDSVDDKDDNKKSRTGDTLNLLTWADNMHTTLYYMHLWTTIWYIYTVLEFIYIFWLVLLTCYCMHDCLRLHWMCLKDLSQYEKQTKYLILILLIKTLILIKLQTTKLVKTHKCLIYKLWKYGLQVTQVVFLFV